MDLNGIWATLVAKSVCGFILECLLKGYSSVRWKSNEKNTGFFTSILIFRQCYIVCLIEDNDLQKVFHRFRSFLKIRTVVWAQP